MNSSLLPIRENIISVRQKLRGACLRAGRSPEDIELVAVTKRVPAHVIKEALAAGVTTLGENRVQELIKKQEVLGTGPQWHLIGHLQTNKVKYIVGRVSLIHSLDSINLAAEINKLWLEREMQCNVLIQVNISGENSKYGLPAGEVCDFIKEVALMPSIRVRGLMTIAPFEEDPERTRPVFSELRLLSEKLSIKFPEVKLQYLSMGMTNDYTVAVEEGANIIRVGTALFGARIY